MMRPKCGRVFGFGAVAWVSVAAWAPLASSMLAAAPAAPPASAPAYRQVKAELIRPRGGLPNVLAKLQAGGEVRVAHSFGRFRSREG